MNRLDQDENLLKLIEHANALIKEIQEFKSKTGIKVEAVNVFGFNNSMCIMVDKIPANCVERTCKVGDNVHRYAKVCNAELLMVELGDKNGKTV